MMLYEEIAEQMHFFNFVFYEVADKTMYVFCPNCGQTHEISLKNCKVSDVKKSVKPCGCFEDFKEQPHFYRSRDPLNGLNCLKTVGVFRNDNGEAVLDVYHHTASFGANNYDLGGNDDFGYALKRYPVYSDKHVIEIRYKADGKVAYDTRLYIPPLTNFIAVGDWREAKSWRATFFFDIIEDSIENLKGTTLEQWTPYISRIVKAIEKRRNIEYRQFEDYIASFFMRLHTSQVFRKLFNAGFDCLCFQNVEDIAGGTSPNKYYYTSIESSNGIINWRGKKLEKILGVQLSKIDKIYKRKSLLLKQLSELQKFAKFEEQNVELTRDNLKIANAWRFDAVAAKFAFYKIPISKAFKYLRRLLKVDKNELCISDYYDYLDDLQYLKIKITSDVLFPRNFNATHARYAAIRREKQLTANSKKFAQKIKPYTSFDYSDSDFEIKVIRSQKDLIEEATKLHNCSAGYINSILSGISVLFTVKQLARPKEPYCMVEYSPRKIAIVQNRGIRNAQPEQAEKDFVQRWFKNIVLPNIRKTLSASAS